MSPELFLSGLQQGLILVIITYAIMIPFRILNFADLSSEGAYPFGAAICSFMLITGYNPYIAVLASILCSGLLGIATSLIYLRLNVNSLLAGIITSTMSYSLVLRILGKPNIALLDIISLFPSNADITQNILILFTIVSLLTIPLYFFLKTEIGLSMRAVGANPDFARKQNISIEKYTILGLFAGGAFAGFAGSLTVQLQTYMDVGMGVGILIHALAALMIGESLTGNQTLLRQLLAPLVGGIIYQQIQGIALNLGLAPSDLKFFTGSLVLIIIAINRQSHK